MITTTMNTTTVTNINNNNKNVNRNNNNNNNDHLADELGVINNVELLPGEQLLPTNKAGEAFQVENLT